MSTIRQEDQRGFRRGAFRARTAIVSDVRLFRESLASSLATRSDIDVVNSVSADADAIGLIALAHPEIILLDAAAPDAWRFVRSVMARMPAARIIAFAPPASELASLLFTGASIAAYVGRDASVDELIAALHGVLRDRRPGATGTAGTSRSASGAANGSTKLTAREREILGLIDLGFSNKHIARELRLSHATVKNHVHNVLDKLNVHRRGEAAARFRSEDLPD